MKTEKFPVTISEFGVFARIRKAIQFKNGHEYTSYVVEYNLLGKRTREWRTDLEDAKRAAQDACRRIAKGQQLILTLKNDDRLEYIRAKEALAGTGTQIDVVCREYAHALTILCDKGTILEACLDFAKRISTELTQITVCEAIEKLKKQVKADGKSDFRRKQLSAALDRFAASFSCFVHTVTPSLVASYLTSLPFSERTKRNHRDVIGYFGRWLVLNRFLPKGTNLLDGVQKYSARIAGEIEIYTPEEMELLLSRADQRILPFLLLAGFAGLRHAEIARLEWQDIDFDEGFIEVKDGKSKTKIRRIVPMKENLNAWLVPLARQRGAIVPFANISKQLLKLARTAKLCWKHNALRHSYISYRVAECGDVPRVADECGNSPYVIRTNYLRRVRPMQATAWFNIMPNTPPANIVPVAVEQQVAA